MKKKIRILVLEPYYGGSHQQFLDGLQAIIDADFVFMTLPDRKWKMRMQLAAFWFVEKIKNLKENEKRFDVVLCSTFVDVTALRSELSRVSGWNKNARILTYFHENQFAYPNQIEHETCHQFTAINFTTAVCSDSLAFNSRYNRDSFIEGCAKYLKKAVDIDLSVYPEKFLKKSVILYPGMQFERFTDYTVKEKAGNPPVIVWNHRWEHDKNPEPFFKSLYALKKQKISFKLILLGKAYRNRPACFDQAIKNLTNEIIHVGYVESYDKYLALLHQGDFVVSTALQEFYGISVIEAVRAGNRPLLPARLSYQELFDGEFLYREGSLERALIDCIKNKTRLKKSEAKALTNRFCWKSLQGEYESWLFGE